MKKAAWGHVWSSDTFQVERAVSSPVRLASGVLCSVIPKPREVCLLRAFQEPAQPGTVRAHPPRGGTLFTNTS